MRRTSASGSVKMATERDGARNRFGTEYSIADEHIRIKISRTALHVHAHVHVHANAICS